jgi:hypothetical protein
MYKTQELMNLFINNSKRILIPSYIINNIKIKNVKECKNPTPKRKLAHVEKLQIKENPQVSSFEDEI